MVEIVLLELNLFLNERQMAAFNVFLERKYCVYCDAESPDGLKNVRFFIDSNNCIIISGICSLCGHPMSYTVDFADDESLYYRILCFRESRQN